MRPWQVLAILFVAIIAFIVARRRLPGRPRRFWVATAVIGLLVIVALASTVTNGTPAAATPTNATPRADTDYQTVDVRDLKKNPDAYKGKLVQVRGEVFNIREQSGRTFLQMWVSIPGGTQFDREAVVVTYGGPLPNIYEKTPIAVFGTGAGTDSGTNAFGGTNTQPAIHADRVMLAP